LVAGPQALVPNSERYALWMLTPHCLVTAVAWHHVALHLRQQKWLSLAAALTCGAWLLSFQYQYFLEILLHNSVTENAFATGPTEPKQAAFEAIVQQQRDRRVTRIYTEDWWTYWALKYLSLAREEIFEVTILDTPWSHRYPVDFLLSPLDERTTRAFYVGYATGDLVRRIGERNPSMQRIDIAGYANRKILTVLCSP
jgi:hypothetical protein